MSALRRTFGALAATAVGLSAGLIVGTAPAHAETPEGDLLILLDASGSMAEPDGTRGGKVSKMQAARKAVHGVVDALPDDSRVGLRAYGPPATGDGCKASKLLAPIETIDRKRLTGTVDGLKEGGDTPIGYSLKQAAEDFSGDRPRTILLISDGEESCDGDPVKVAKEITDKGLNLRVDVVSFRVDAQARDQLTKLAQAGHGAYFDAQDGAALFSRLKRASSHAIRGYQPAGRQVTGSTDGLNPPVLKPGQYRDVMPPDHGEEKPSRFYAFDVPKGATGYVSATVPWSTPLGADAKNQIGIKVTTADTELYCNSDSGYKDWYGGGSVTVTAQVTVPYDPKAKEGECGSGGRYLVEVDNAGSKFRTGTVPLELVVVVEPAAGTKGLPEPYAEEKEAVAPKVAGPVGKASGSGSYGEAPVLSDGVYEDILRPGEEVFYRVPVNWGQRMSYQIKLPKLDAERKAKLDGSGVFVRTTISNPVRADAAQPSGDELGYYTGEPEVTNGSTVPVRYRNREVDDTSTQATSLPGYYYIGLRMDANAKDPYFELPVTVVVDVSGKAAGAPAYRDPDKLGSPDEQLEVDLVSGTGKKRPGKDSPLLPTSVLWVGAGLGGLLLLGGGGVATLLLLRR